jgi:glucosylceramidase
MWNLALDENAEPSRLGRRPTTGMNKGLLRIISDRMDDVTFESGFFSLGHFSKFVDPNAYRINSTTMADEIESVAFQNPDSKIVLVVISRINEEKNVRINWASQSFQVKIPVKGAATFKLLPK